MPLSEAEIVLLRPPVSISTATWHISNAPPLGMAYLCASLKQNNFQVKVIDALGEDLENYGPTKNNKIFYRGLSPEAIIKAIPNTSKLLMVSCMFSIDWNHVREIIIKIKQEFPNLTILVGGEHITAIPKYILESTPEIDYCCLGEGDEFVIEFCKSFFSNQGLESINGLAFRKHGQVIVNPKRNRIKSVNELPWPAWDDFPIENYLDSQIAFGIELGRTMPMLATRGCPYECTFCSNDNMWGTNYYARDPKDIIAEINYYKKKYNITGIEFHDLTIFVGKKWIVDFCTQLIENEINLDWTVTVGTRSEGLDAQSLKLLKDTGCKYICFAPESGSERMLKDSKKRLDLDRILKTIKLSSDIGLLTKVNIIIGFPEEKRLDILKTFLFVWKCAALGVDDTGFTIFYPYPGSKLFYQIYKEGEITLGEDFFNELFNWEILKFRKHYCKHVSSFELTLYKFFGISSFYLLSYLLHPRKIFSLLINFRKGTYTTRLEKFLYGLFVKKDNFVHKIAKQMKSQA